MQTSAPGEIITACWSTLGPLLLKGMTIDTRTIETKAQFLAFVDQLRADLKDSPEEFENLTLDDFLNALSAWVADSDGYYRNIAEGSPPPVVWRYIADVLSGAAVYE
jgi:hypothetical protein